LALVSPESVVMALIEAGNVAFARLTELGVPRAGVTRVGEVDSTAFPDPVVAMPPKTPELLYWIWLLEPPGAPPAEFTV
jgi:hypothetical protein